MRHIRRELIASVISDTERTLYFYETESISASLNATGELIIPTVNNFSDNAGVVSAQTVGIFELIIPTVNNFSDNAGVVSATMSATFDLDF